MIEILPPLGSNSVYFAHHLKELRQRLVGKQLCLSWAVGCSDAAVSFWESGKRIPNRGTLSRILGALAEGGASSSELSNLHDSWRRARTVKRSAAVRREIEAPRGARTVVDRRIEIRSPTPCAEMRAQCARTKAVRTKLGGASPIAELRLFVERGYGAPGG
jgi:hypothetical protein